MSKCNKILSQRETWNINTRGLTEEKEPEGKQDTGACEIYIHPSIHLNTKTQKQKDSIHEAEEDRGELYREQIPRV